MASKVCRYVFQLKREINGLFYLFLCLFSLYFYFDGVSAHKIHTEYTDFCRQYTRGNESLIVDTFQGQLKSKVSNQELLLSKKPCNRVLELVLRWRFTNILAR